MNLNENHKRLIFFSALLLACWFLYSPLLGVGFFDEDDWYHLEYADHTDGLPTFVDKLPELISAVPDTFPSGESRVLPTLLTWWFVNYELWGTQAWGHHLMALLILIGCALLVFRVTRQLTHSLLPSAGAALLFAVFPYNVQLVGSAYAISMLLMNFGFLASLAFYLSFRKASTSLVDIPGRKRTFYGLSLFFCLVAVTAHEGSYGLPLVLLFVDMILTRQDRQLSIKSTIIRTAPFFMIVGFFVLLVMFRAVKFDSFNNLDSGYLYKLAVPWWKLVTYVPESFVTPFFVGYGRNQAMVGIAIFAAIGLVVFGIKSWRSQNRWLLGIFAFWILVTFMPVANVLGRTIFPEEAEGRYLVLPMTGFCIALAVLATSPTGAWRKPRIFGIALLGLFVLLFVIGFHGNTKYYLDQHDAQQNCLRSLRETMHNAPDQSSVFFVYNGDQDRRERILAGFLEYTFNREYPHRWFFMNNIQALPVVDGRFPDLTVPIPTPIDDNVAERGTRRGAWKRPKYFPKIMVPLSSNIYLFDTKSEGVLVNLAPKLLERFSQPPIPEVLTVEQIRSAEVPEATLERQADQVFIMGDIYRIFPGIGRF